MYVVIPHDLTAEKSINITVRDTDFAQDDKHKIFIYSTDYLNTSGDFVNIHLTNNTFSGEVKDKLPIVFDGEPVNYRIDARNNYWGTEQGPYHAGSLEPTNGPQLPEFVDYIPFLTQEIGSEPKEEIDNDIVYKECCSSVIFIPGIQGSRLYNKRDNGTEDQLWEPNIPNDIEDLYGDAQGNTDPSIYTRDILERTNILGPNVNLYPVYQNISNNLINLKSTNAINDWLPVPYDWRENVNDIVDNGIKLEDKTMQLIPEIEKMAKDSQTGKITLLTHSNGGLLSKMLIKELESQNKSHLIDKVIMVSAPQTGTPSAIYALLHGLYFDWKFRPLAPQKYNRELAQNIEMTYALLPSREYYDTVSHTVIFDESLGEYGNLLASYGGDIDSYEEMKSFVLGQVDGRADAEFDKTNQIGLGNEYLYNKAEIVHNEIDSYEFSENIKLYQISGTGSMTSQAILYKNRKTLARQVFTPYLVKTMYGDGTVLNKSSAVMNGSKFYFDLYNYNKDTGLDLDHANILESVDLVNFINGLIKDTGITTSPYVDTLLPDYSGIKTTKISMHSPVDIHLYDSQGRHTGPVYIEANGELVKSIEENIPNSQYELIGETASIIVSGVESYNLKLDGYDSGVFTLDIENYIGDSVVNTHSFVDLPATSELTSDIIIDSNRVVSEINLDTDGDKKIDIVAKNDGTVLDLNKPEEPVVKDEIPKDILVLPASGGVVSVQFLEKTNPVNIVTKDIVYEIPKIDIVSPVPKIVKNNTTLPKKPVVNNVNKNIPISNPPAVGNKSQIIKSQQTASVGNAEISKRFNIIEFIKRIFKKK